MEVTELGIEGECSLAFLCPLGVTRMVKDFIIC